MDESLQLLKKGLEEVDGLEFERTSNPDIWRAKRADGSSVDVAVFAKPGGETLAMIDHKNIRDDEREKWHKHWRKLIDELFACSS